jgi:hypothetical protein
MIQAQPTASNLAPVDSALTKPEWVQRRWKALSKKRHYENGEREKARQDRLNTVRAGAGSAAYDPALSSLQAPLATADQGELASDGTHQRLGQINCARICFVNHSRNSDLREHLEFRPKSPRVHCGISAQAQLWGAWQAGTN